jgi:hypothetical protein
MSLSKNNVHFPNRNFEPIVTPNVVDYSSNLHLPGPREYHFTWGKSMFADDAMYILSS